MAGVWSDPTSAGVVYPDPTAPSFVAPIVLPEPDPVFRDDALFASASQNWRAVPVPIPPLPVLDASGRLVVAPPAVVGGAIMEPGSVVSGPVVSGPIVSGPIVEAPPTAAVLRDRAVAALKAPPVRYQAPASRGGSRSTYTAPAPTRGPRRSMSGRSMPGSSVPGRPQGSVTTSPSTWLPVASGPRPNTATVPNQWQASAPPPTWLPTTSTGAPTGRGTRPFTRGGGPLLPPGSGTPRAPGTGRRRSKGWIPGVLVVGFIVAVNVGPHIGGWFHHSIPGGVDAAVNSYYTDMAGNDPTSAAGLVCDARQSAWASGQSKPTSDSRRGIVDHSIRSTKSRGNGTYTVLVDLNLSNNVPARATVTVQHEDGTYHLCAGTRP